MRKAKVITVLSLTVVMLVAMTGIAAACPEYIFASPDNQALDLGQSPPDGTFSSYSVAVTTIQPKLGGNTHTIKATTTLIVSGTGGALTDLRFNFTHGASSSGWLTSGTSWTWIDGGDTSDSLTLDVMNTGTAPDIKYQFRLDDSYPIGDGFDTAQGTSYGTSIPEFATIAIPVAAILGLVLFFNHRKRRKE
jgi:hypothetical protein